MAVVRIHIFDGIQMAEINVAFFDEIAFNPFLTPSIPIYESALSLKEKCRTQRALLEKNQQRYSNFSRSFVTNFSLC